MYRLFTRVYSRNLWHISMTLRYSGCPQADEPVIGDGIPDGVKEPDFDECGGQVGENRTYRVYTWSDCFETLTCSQPSGLIGDYCLIVLV